MATTRRIKKVWKSRPTIEGAGVHLQRAFGQQEVAHLDPFLLLDDFRSNDPIEYESGFPWHPHRGMETITYVLAGTVEHDDSLGNRGVISAGDVQWMTAGSGIIHQEMPKGDREGSMWGFQLWANLPRQHKMMDPRYQEVKRADIPIVNTADGATVRVICGEVAGMRGPVRNVVIEPEYLDVSLPPGRTMTHAVKATHTVFAYVFEGEAYFDAERDPYTREDVGDQYIDMARPCACGDHSVIHYDAGDMLSISTEDKPVRFLLVSGKPLNEPVAWYGPIVMNTQAELRIAFREFEDGTFVKHRGRQRPD